MSTFAGQAVGAGVIALLLLGFNRQYGKSYLFHWTLAWTALAVHHIAAGLAMLLAVQFQLTPWHPALLACTLISGVTSYLQVGWLLFGVYELVRRRPVRIVESRQILIALAVVGALTSLPLFAVNEQAAMSHFLRIGVRGFVGAIVLVVASVALWRARKRREGIGFTILSGAVFFYGIEQAHYAVLSVIRLASGFYPEYLFHLGYLDFLLQSVVGVGMVACLLEDEREAAELATVEIEHLAYHDALTGLPNRPLFVDRLIVALAQASRANHKLAVFFLDLDRFKDINDSLGHSLGDTLLKAVAERIRRCVRDGDTVARFGGDEFTLLIPRIEDVDEAAKIAQKVLETLKIPYLIGDRELFVTTSIGVSLYPIDGMDPETLVRNADTAMYRAKENGRDNYQLYAPAMNARALERLALENMLRKALAHQELVLHYQPIVDLGTDSVVAVEALIRWNHPEMGLVSPAHFISVAEVSGLIIPIGQWVLTTSCKQVRQWQKKLGEKLVVSVNLSARQFQQTNLVDQVSRALHDSGLAPESLQLEITESNAMQNAENTMYTLRDLKSLGVRIAMDDFGTGYSSLNYLKRFPIDTLKLDQMFVKDISTDSSDAAIVSAVIAMAHSLKLKVVAEGVETEEQLDFLRAEGCDTIQGYLFSRPLAAEQLERYLVERRGTTQSTRRNSSGRLRVVVDS